MGYIYQLTTCESTPSLEAQAMNRIIPTAIVIAALIGLGGSYLIGRWNVPPIHVSTTPSQMVVVAARDLSAGTVLEENDLGKMLSLETRPICPFKFGFATDIQKLKGKRIKRDLDWGQIVSESDVGPVIKLPEGKFRYEIAEQVRGVVGKGYVWGVNDGDHMDVFLSEYLPDGKTRSSTLLHNLLVLQTQALELSNSNRALVSWSLAVTPEEGAVLKAAEKRGKLRVLTRNRDE